MKWAYLHYACTPYIVWTISHGNVSLQILLTRIFDVIFTAPSFGYMHVLLCQLPIQIYYIIMPRLFSINYKVTYSVVYVLVFAAYSI